MHTSRTILPQRKPCAHRETGRRGISRWLRLLLSVPSGLVIAILGYFCLVIYLTDLYAAAVIKANNQKLIEQQARMAAVAGQLSQLEAAVNERARKHARLYNQVLLREGRLTEKHIVGPAVSRLTLPTPQRSVAVSRSHSRSAPQHFAVTVPSAVTAYELEQVLAGTGLAGLGRDFVLAELRYGINAVFLTALAIHESHWGNSLLAKAKHNLFGFCAYDDNPYAHAAAFTTKRECIQYVAQYIRDNYIYGPLSKGSRISDISRNYATDPVWGEKIFRLMLQIDNTIKAGQPTGKPPKGGEFSF